MQREQELAIGDALLERIQAGPPPATTRAASIDPSIYTDADRHRREVAAIAASPVAALASSELAEPGSFVTTTLVGTPIIITRDRDGVVHAMRNVCAHRGATVETRESGSARIFSCGFHAWSYELDGSLRSISDASLFSFGPCTTGLRPLRCEERHGIIWITPCADAVDESVADWLDQVDAFFDELGLSDMEHYASTTYELGCNWKLLTDGFLEVYHLKYLHRDSIAPYFPANTFLPRRFGPHFAGWLPKNRLVSNLTEEPRDDWKVLDRLTGAIVLVPGTIVQWQAGHIELFSLRPDPVDPSRSTARLTMMIPSARADETELWERNWERVCVTIPEEDFAAAVDVQRNIDAGMVDRLQIGNNEHALIEHIDAVTERANSTSGRD